MDKALENALAAKPYIAGMLCADSNGLEIASKGELVGSNAGRFVSLTRLAGSLHPDQQTPNVLIETQTRNIVVKDYDGMTIAMSTRRAT